MFEYTLFADLIQVNSELELPEFSNDGQYLKLYFSDDLKRLTGSRTDDSENVFTARMLLILESEWLFNEHTYRAQLQAIIEHYSRDRHGKPAFRPLFLLNDLLRYWRTLCLNYEERRHDDTKPWRKKNVNLKFSRMMTVFATVLPLVLNPTALPEELCALCGTRPLARLATALDSLDDPALAAQWPLILDAYEHFLCWKEHDNIEAHLGARELKEQVDAAAERLSKFLHVALTHDSIAPEYRRYLVL